MKETSKKNKADGRIRITAAMQMEHNIQVILVLECIAWIKRAKNNTKKFT
jgi:hypothetical protein